VRQVVELITVERQNLGIFARDDVAERGSLSNRLISPKTCPLPSCARSALALALRTPTAPR
jgi:hypothetical protein